MTVWLCGRSPLPGASLPPVPASDAVTLRQSWSCGRRRSCLPFSPTPPSRRRDNLRRLVLLDEPEVFVKEPVAVVAEGDIIGQKDDVRARVRTGFLSFRGEQIHLRNCSSFLVRRGLFGWFWPTRVVVLSDYGWWFWTTTMSHGDCWLNLF